MNEVSAGQYPSFYQAYGLTVKSWMLLPELFIPTEPFSDSPIVEIFPSGELCNEQVVETLSWRIDGDTISTTWSKVGKILIHGTFAMECSPCPSVDALKFRLFIACQGFSLLLHRLGRLVLHSSAVVVNGKAVLFIADSRGGKSTMAAFAIATGHALLTDDVGALSQSSDGQWQVHGGYPHMRIETQTLQNAGIVDVSNGPSIAGTHKILYPVTNNYVASAPLGGIFVLGIGEKVSVTTPSIKEALGHLFHHTYTHQLIASLDQANHLRQCLSLASQGYVKVLKRPRDLSKLPACWQAVCDQIR